MHAQEVVQLHRDSTRNNRVLTDLTLAAGIEHLVWRITHPVADETIQDALWDILTASRWPSTNAHNTTNGGIGVLILPRQCNLLWLREIESTLRGHMTDMGFTPKTAKALTGATSEILNNVWQHAHTPGPSLLAYHREPTRINIGVADIGIGVLQSLRMNPTYASFTTSMAALKKAMAVGVSSVQEEGRGYGFDTVLRAVADQWGAVRLRTGQAILEFRGTTDVRAATTGYGVELPGLQVVFTCPTTPGAPVAL